MQVKFPTALFIMLFSAITLSKAQSFMSDNVKEIVTGNDRFVEMLPTMAEYNNLKTVLKITHDMATTLDSADFVLIGKDSIYIKIYSQDNMVIMTTGYQILVKGEVLYRRLNKDLNLEVIEYPRDKNIFDRRVFTSTAKYKELPNNGLRLILEKSFQ
jgi:hypothetical protein